MQKVTLTEYVIKYNPEAVLYSTLLYLILRSYFCMFSFNPDSSSSAIPQACYTSNSRFYSFPASL